MNRSAAYSLVLLGLLLTTLAGPLRAQLFEDNRYVVSEMNYLGETLTEDSYAIFVNLPYPGIIDLKLMDDGGKPLYFTHFVKEKGKQRIGIKTHSLTHGQTYNITLSYKGISSAYSFQVPEGPFPEEGFASR